MASVINICNQALFEVGANTITSLLDQSVEARACSAIFDTSRDAVLEAREWTFAVTRRTLAKSATPPEFGATSKFKIPNDCIRVLECFEYGSHSSSGRAQNELYWTREGEYIHADCDVLSVRYLARIEDPNKFSPSFIKALVMYLASELSIPIQRSKSLQETKYSLFTERLQAANVDGMQGRVQRIRSSRLTGIRRR